MSSRACAVCSSNMKFADAHAMTFTEILKALGNSASLG